MNCRRIAILGLMTLALGLGAQARGGTILITFDPGDPIGGLAVGSTLGNQYAASGVVFSPNAFSGPGGPTGTWATNSNMTIVSSTGSDVGGLGSPSLVSGNLIRSFNAWLNEDGDPTFSATFSTPISSLSATFAGIATAASTGLQAYNGTTLLTSSFATGTGQQTLTVSSSTPITKVVFRPGDFFDWVGVDNITFTTLEPSNAVPEPSTWLGAAAGVASLVALKRRRRAA